MRAPLSPQQRPQPTSSLPTPPKGFNLLNHLLVIALALCASACDFTWFGPIFDYPPDGSIVVTSTNVITKINSELMGIANPDLSGGRQIAPNPNGTYCANLRGMGGDAQMIYFGQRHIALSVSLTTPTQADPLGGPPAWCVQVYQDDAYKRLEGLLPSFSPAIDHPNIGASAHTIWISNNSNYTRIEQLNAQQTFFTGSMSNDYFDTDADLAFSQWVPAHSIGEDHFNYAVNFDYNSGTLWVMSSPDLATDNDTAPPPAPILTYSPVPIQFYTNGAFKTKCIQPNGLGVECLDDVITTGGVVSDNAGNLFVTFSNTKDLNGFTFIQTWIVDIWVGNGTTQPFILYQFKVPVIDPSGRSRDVFFPAIAPEQNNTGNLAFVANTMVPGGYVSAMRGVWTPRSGSWTEQTFAQGSESLDYYRDSPIGQRFGDYNACATKPQGGALCLTNVPVSGSLLQPWISAFPF